MLRRKRPNSRPSAEDLQSDKLTPDQKDALRNILATQEARKTDPSIYHVQTIRPDLIRYPTPEELEQLHAAAGEWMAELNRRIEERDRNIQD